MSGEERRKKRQREGIIKNLYRGISTFGVSWIHILPFIAPLSKAISMKKKGDQAVWKMLSQLLIRSQRCETGTTVGRKLIKNWFFDFLRRPKTVIDTVRISICLPFYQRSELRSSQLWRREESQALAAQHPIHLHSQCVPPYLLSGRPP